MPRTSSAASYLCQLEALRALIQPDSSALIRSGSRRTSGNAGSAGGCIHFLLIYNTKTTDKSTSSAGGYARAAFSVCQTFYESKARVDRVAIDPHPGSQTNIRESYLRDVDI